MKKSILITLFLTTLLVSCKNEKKQSNQENEKVEKIEIDEQNLENPESKPVVKAGQILVAKSTIEDPIFSKSIILITLIKKGKIYGVMLNKPSDEKISNYIENVKQKDVLIGYGGPVNNDLVCIQTFDSTSENSTEIMKGLYFMGDAEIIKEKLQNNSSSKNEIRFFKGLSVWDFEQLNKEVNEWQDWKIIDLSVSDIMENNSNNLWDKYNN
jgi:putative AlgH/UPF0301 family transcriptional regulator